MLGKYLILIDFVGFTRLDSRANPTELNKHLGQVFLSNSSEPDFRSRPQGPNLGQVKKHLASSPGVQLDQCSKFLSTQA